MYFVLTTHAQERFIQRTNSKFIHIDFCIEEGCPTCTDLKKQIKKIVLSDTKRIKDRMIERLERADEDRSYLNDSNFMDRYYEKYGYDHKYRFLYDDGILFVVKEKKFNIVITCMKTPETMFRRLIKPSKTHADAVPDSELCYSVRM
jgi:hypothetical protein